MSKNKKTKSLKNAINEERAKNQMIRDTRKTTLHVFILLSPFIAMFGITVYGITQ